MEREKFEESLKSAFDNAEISPSEKVWTNIELDLEKAKGGDLKRRLMFYQMLAAASVVFAMAIGGIGYYYSFNKDNYPTRSLAEQTMQSSPDVTAPHTESDPASPGKASADKQTNASPEITGTQADQISAQNQIAIANPDRVNLSAQGTSVDQSSEMQINTSEHTGSTLTAPIPADSKYAALPLRIDERELPALYSKKAVQLTFEKKQEPEVDPVVRMLAELEQRERELQGEEAKKKVADNENLWTSIGFAAGSFNTVHASAPSSAASMQRAPMAYSAAAIVDQESKATGYSYSMGVNVGTRLSDRWVLQGGVNYLTHSSEYTANNVVMDRQASSLMSQRFLPAATNEVFNADEQELHSKIVYTAPYNVNNSMRYLSIPMQAGYLVVDRTFGLQLNAGVATDLFLQNTVKGDGDGLVKTSQPVGADSPYRTVNLSGLLGTEVSYRFGPHYRVSLNPGIRYPFNTIYKSEIGVQSTPLTFDIGLRFRYIFH